jgi:hypothetical protein
MRHGQCVVLISLAAISLSVRSSGQEPAAAAPQKMEIVVEQLDGGAWKQVDPGHVFEHDDRLRFRFKANFNGYLYVMNHGTSGNYSLIFPGEGAGRLNRIVAGSSYQVPNDKALLRISGPAGHEVMYWVVSPVPLPSYSTTPQSAPPVRPDPELLPRCDDTLLQARGECIDSSAGARGIQDLEEVPKSLPKAHDSSGLTFLREQKKSVIAADGALDGPVVYQFRIAHK